VLKGLSRTCGFCVSARRIAQKKLIGVTTGLLETPAPSGDRTSWLREIEPGKTKRLDLWAALLRDESLAGVS